MSTELTHYEGPDSSLAIIRDPEEVLADAQKVAAALMRVVGSKKKQLVFNGETYLESGDWQTVAAFHGVTAKIEWTRHVQYGDVQGFEASAVAIDKTGREISRGEAMCLNDEENWGMRAKYEWVDVLDAQGKKIWEYNEAKGKNLPKRQKVETGAVATPLFQLRSMAQTRACAKALSNLFKWVVVLAGYKPTPAEEMTEIVESGSDPTPSSPKSATMTTTSQPSSVSGGDAPSGTTSAISHDDSEPDIKPRSQRNTQTTTVIPEAFPESQEAQQRAPQGEVVGFEPPISKPQSNRYFAIMRSASVTDEESARQLASLGYHGSRDEMLKRIYNQAIDLLDPKMLFHTNKPK
jgi:hypothetical protein